MAVISHAKFDPRNIQSKLQRHHEIIFEMCSVGGHESYDLMDRIIQSL